MKKTTLLLFFLAALFHSGKTMTPTSAYPTPVFRTGKDRAVFFAVEKYQNGKLTNLQNPVKNARDIAGELNKRFGFETEVLENPTQEQIIGKLDELTKLYTRNENGQYPSDGQLFLFFSGHGMSEDENGYFLPADADPAKPYQKGIAYEIWRPKIDKIKCRHILVAIDACYSVRFDPDWKNKTSGTFKRPGEMTDAQRALANYEDYKARVFFLSDNKEDQTPDRSNFASKMLEGLRTANVTDGFLTSKQLFANYIEMASPTPRAGTFGSDEPSSAFLFYGEIKGIKNVLSNEEKNIPTIKPDPRVQDSLLWESAKKANNINAYEEYLRVFPLGFKRKEGEKILASLYDDQSWAATCNENTSEGYEKYRKEFPNGRHRDQALYKIEEIKKANYYEKNEIWVSFGWASSHLSGTEEEDQYALMSSMGESIRQRAIQNYGQFNVKSGSAFGIGYNRFFKKKSAVGLQLTYELIKIVPNLGTVEKNNIFTITLVYNYSWIAQKRFSLYSAIGLGASLNKIKADIEIDDNFSSNADLSLTLIGVRYGGPIFAFMELSLSPKGLINGGAAYRF